MGFGCSSLQPLPYFSDCITAHLPFPSIRNVRTVTHLWWILAHLSIWWMKEVHMHEGSLGYQMYFCYLKSVPGSQYYIGERWIQHFNTLMPKPGSSLWFNYHTNSEVENRPAFYSWIALIFIWIVFHDKKICYAKFTSENKCLTNRNPLTWNLVEQLQKDLVHI